MTGQYALAAAGVPRGLTGASLATQDQQVVEAALAGFRRER